MRTFFGMILGCLITVGVVYIHDSMATSTVATSTTGMQSQTIVNWDVAASSLDQVVSNAKHNWAKLTAGTG
jgi:hypothetical protein